MLHFIQILLKNFYLKCKPTRGHIFYFTKEKSSRNFLSLIKDYLVPTYNYNFANDKRK